MDLNKVMLIGRLTKNPELRSTPSGQSVTSFSVATNRVFTDASGQKQERPEFHSIVAWGKLAEICSQFLVKGRRVYLEGRLQTRDWVAQDQTKRYTTEVVAENMIILDPPSGGQGGQKTFTPSTSAGQQAPQKQEPQEEERIIEEIPF